MNDGQPEGESGESGENGMHDLLRRLGARSSPPLTLSPSAQARISARLEAAFHTSQPAEVDVSAAGHRPFERRGRILLGVAACVLVAFVVGAIALTVRRGAPQQPAVGTYGCEVPRTEVASPLVDIRCRLTGQSAVELFRVDADAPAYWRATTLPEFDGRQWRLPTGALERVDGTFGAAQSGDRLIRQQFRMTALGGQLVPAAADPVAAGFGGNERLDLRINRDTNTLLAPDEIQPGDLFTVVSSTPELTPDRLRQVDTINAPDPIFSDLPDGIPDVVRRLAADVTAGATTQYDAAIALQDWFRSEFDYDLDVAAGHGVDAIEGFLESRRGYCEQFAATYAVMARTIGIPSRVAVGFTPGTLDADGWYRVTGANAHAWPELWFDGIGWVAFEPTPGRGAPGAESYTGVESQSQP